MKNIGYRKLCSMMSVCFCVCVPNTKHRQNALEQGLRKIIVLKAEGVGGRWKKLHSEQLHDWTWRVNVGGW